jgi:tetratricopeptide (TPR) repeat protein
MRLAFTIVLTAAIAGCAGRGPHPARPDFGPVVDAPYELADDLDLDEQRDHMFGLPPSPERIALRARLAAALVGRAVGHVTRGRWHLADESLLELAELWQGDRAAMADGLAPHRAALRQVTDTFRRAGADAEIVTALVLTHAAERGEPAAERAELDEVLVFLDDLATAEHGAVGRHARVLPALQPIALRAAPPWLIDLYVERAVERQRLVGEHLAKDGASFALVAAHRDVLSTARAIASALARAGRATDIAAAIAPVRGIGEDAAIATAAARVARADATARDWIALARAVRGSAEGTDDDSTDPGGALAICEAALVRFPDDVTLLVAAADHASALDRIQQPIHLLERARARAPRDAELAGRLADVYRERLAQLAFGGRPRAAVELLERLERFYREVEQDTATSWSASRARTLATVGRGLVSQGLVDDATRLLERSARMAPSSEAYEMLGTVAIKRERWAEAQVHLAAGLALPATTPAARYAKAKLLRLGGDAAAGAGDLGTARRLWIGSLALWADLGDEIELPPNLAGERLVESGRALWALEDAPRAIELLEMAVDADRDGGDTHIQVVSFLILRGRYDEALDAYHRALGSDRIGDYHKVYMSLWVIAEARRRGVTADPLAVDYLASRDGGLWYDRLAQLASGRATIAQLRTAATTRARRAELAYYSAVLGLGAGGRAPGTEELTALFEAVIATDMVLFFEYDMARHWRRTLDQG